MSLRRQLWRTGAGEFGEANPGGQGQGAPKGPPGGEGGGPEGAPCLWPPGFVSPKLPLSPPPGLSPSNSPCPPHQGLTQTPCPHLTRHAPVSAFGPQKRLIKMLCLVLWTVSISANKCFTNNITVCRYISVISCTYYVQIIYKYAQPIMLWYIVD